MTRVQGRRYLSFASSEAWHGSQRAWLERDLYLHRFIRPTIAGNTCGLDLTIVDLDLLDGSAEEFIRESGKRTSGAAVLALTTNCDRVGEIRGTSEVLTRGASVDEILAAARQLVG